LPDTASVNNDDKLTVMEATPLQQLSVAISMLSLLVLVMKPKLRAALGESRTAIDQGEQNKAR
jgi:hypothetical protein